MHFVIIRILFFSQDFSYFFYVSIERRRVDKDSLRHLPQQNAKHSVEEENNKKKLHKQRTDERREVVCVLRERIRKKIAAERLKQKGETFDLPGRCNQSASIVNAKEPFSFICQ